MLDTSVAAKWLFPEVWTDEALRLRSQGHDLLAPDLLATEAMAVIVKRVRRRLLEPDHASAMAEAIPLFPVTLVPTAPLLRASLALAISHEQTIYDSLYVALAVREACPLITADRRLYDALAAAFPGTLLWVGDLPAAPP